MNVGEKITFNYSGGIQTFIVPETGLYLLDIYGAQGGSKESYVGGRGGHSQGYKELTKNTILYVVVGGYNLYGGYNGGGSANPTAGFWGCGGGGATHIAKTSGVLKDVAKNDLLIVAGGGGGCCVRANGAAGGGLTGSNGGTGSGGTQTSGGRAGDFATAGSYGQGGTTSGSFADIGGGGGGLYGGGGSYTGGSGGSGYIDGVPAIAYKGETYNPLTENGIRTGNGLAEITFIAKGFPTIHIGSGDIVDAKLGNAQVEAVYLGSTPLA